MALRDLMGMVTDSTSWTGRSKQLHSTLQGLKMHSTQASPVETLGSGEVKDRYEITDHTPEAKGVAVTVIEKPVEKPIPSVLTEIRADLKEYAELAAIVGINPAELLIESFKAFLHEHDIPVFNLKEVVAYMDDKAKKESKNQAGWEWRPLRERDHRVSSKSLAIEFGRAAARKRDSQGYSNGAIETPASDFYFGPRIYRSYSSNNNNWFETNTPSKQDVYDKLVPLHALKKVALIDKHFGDKVGLFVCDYAPIPAIQYPDPFLMAVIANPKLKEGEGRYVIDFWDEPGFGLASQLK